jgi:hypothetical protein
MNSKLKRPDQVIDALGGTQAVADLFGLRYGVVWNWRIRGLPADTYAVMQRALAQEHLTAPDGLWSQRESV